MSIARILLAAMAGGAGACLCAAAGRADHVALNARPGLWEMTMATQYSGTPAIPPEAAARLTPEQRAKLATSMAAVATRASETYCTPRAIGVRPFGEPANGRTWM